ncbi:hypothetical protein THOM_2752, partial [Trachipleistophora hominis]
VLRISGCKSVSVVLSGGNLDVLCWSLNSSSGSDGLLIGEDLLFGVEGNDDLDVDILRGRRKCNNKDLVI